MSEQLPLPPAPAPPTVPGLYIWQDSIVWWEAGVCTLTHSRHPHPGKWTLDCPSRGSFRLDDPGPLVGPLDIHPGPPIEGSDCRWCKELIG